MDEAKEGGAVDARCKLVAADAVVDGPVSTTDDFKGLVVGEPLLVNNLAALVDGVLEDQA